MKACSPWLVAILSLALTALCSAQTTEENSQPEPEATSGENLSPPDADSTGDVTEESDEAVPDESESPSPAEQAFQRALQHEQENELDKAIKDCTEAIQSDADNLEYLITRAELYGELRDRDNAMKDAATILKTDRSNIRAHVLRGQMFELAGDPQQALVEFNAAVEQNPTEWKALLARAEYFQRQGETDKATADSDRLIQLEPDLAAGYLTRALTQGGAGNHEEAAKYAQLVLERNPDSWLACLLRASSRASKGDDAGAREDYDRALQLSPDNASVLAARSAFFAVTGEYKKSLADLQTAAALEPRNTFVKAELADSLATCPDESLRDGNKAAEYSAQALELAPNDPSVWSAAAAVAAENGDFDAAIKWQQRLLASKTLSHDMRVSAEGRLEAYNSRKPYRLNVPSPEKFAALVKIKEAQDAIKNGNFDRGIALLSEAIAADPKDPTPYVGRGFAYRKQHKYELAIRDLDTAINLNPKDPESYRYRVVVLEKTGQNKKALDDLLRMYEINSESDKGMENSLAWFYATCPDAELRDGGKAAEYIDRELELRPNEPRVWDTVAAVFAENGDFEDAIEWEKAYLDRGDISDEERDDGNGRLALYEQHKPCRYVPKD